MTDALALQGVMWGTVVLLWLAVGLAGFLLGRFLWEQWRGRRP
jgi:hypothetical protein